MMTVRRAIYDGRVRGVESAVELWKLNHDTAMEVRDIEEIVQESLAVLDLLVSWQREAWRRLHSGAMDNVLECGAGLKGAYDKGFDIIELVATCITFAENDGYSVDCASTFRQRADEVTKQHAGFSAGWPFPPHEKIAVGIAAIEQGDWITPERWIGELQDRETGSA